MNETQNTTDELDDLARRLGAAAVELSSNLLGEAGEAVERLSAVLAYARATHLDEICRMASRGDLPPMSPATEEAPAPDGQSPITPASVAAHVAPLEIGTSSLVWSSDDPERGELDWAFDDVALADMERLGFTRDDVMLAVTDPLAVGVADGDRITVFRRGRIEVDTHLPGHIVGVRPATSEGRSLRPRGGAGRRMPDSIQDLVDALTQNGAVVTRGKKHIKATLNGKTITLPSTPGDHRSLRNAVSLVKRLTDIDVTT